MVYEHECIKSFHSINICDDLFTDVESNEHWRRNRPFFVLCENDGKNALPKWVLNVY